jgi:SAM-dependent methyltransferase
MRQGRHVRPPAQPITTQNRNNCPHAAAVVLCTWARDHWFAGTGVDVSSVFIGSARERARKLRVADKVSFVHGDASRYVARERVEATACVGATWIGGGVAGTVGLLRRSLVPGGIMLIGEPYWRKAPPDQETVDGCRGIAMDEWKVGPASIFRAPSRAGGDTVT